MTRALRNVGILLIGHLVAIMLAFLIGRLAPAAGQLTFQFGLHPSSLYLLDVSRQLSIQLGRGMTPFPNYSWSPDGRQIAFVALENSKSHIFRVEVQCPSLLTTCGAPIDLTRRDETDLEPAWAPDGRSLTFVREHNGTPDIYWMAVDGGTAYNLTNDPAIDSFPVWSPDGRYMAFYSDRGGSLEIYVMNMACLEQVATCPSAVHRLGGGFNSLPVWSPDSSQLAYFADGDILLADTGCLARQDDCTRHARNLTISSHTDWYPVWSPDGEEVLFQSNRNDRPQIYAIDTRCAGSSDACTMPISTRFTLSLSPTFSPDGRYIALLANSGSSREIYIVNRADASVQQVTNLGTGVSNPHWRPAVP